MSATNGVRPTAHRDRSWKSAKARIEVAEVSAGYGRDMVISDVSLAVQPGEVTLIIGSNGSGKSTLLKALFGQAVVFGGSALLDGIDLLRATIPAKIEAGVRYVPQSGGVFPGMTVEENLRLAAHDGTRRSRNEHLELVQSIFPMLPRLLPRRVGELSGGQQRMVAFAMGVATAPRFLLIDEPSAGLSPLAADAVLDHLVSISNTLGTGILLVEQNVGAACRIAKVVHAMQDGCLQWSGSPSELFAHETLVSFL
jgi:branched-chain amino acid transport system ATP-binding protein